MSGVPRTTSRTLLARLNGKFRQQVDAVHRLRKAPRSPCRCLMPPGAIAISIGGENPRPTAHTTRSLNKCLMPRSCNVRWTRRENILVHEAADLPRPVLSPPHFNHPRSCTQLPSALSQCSKEEASSCPACETEWAGRGNTTELRTSRGL